MSERETRLEAFAKWVECWDGATVTALKKLTAKQNKILDEIDTLTLAATKEFYRTKEEDEKRFGFKLAPPSWVEWDRLKSSRGSIKALDSLVKKGLLEKRIRLDHIENPVGYDVRRPNLPPDYYISSLSIDNAFCPTGPGEGQIQGKNGS